MNVEMRTMCKSRERVVHPCTEWYSALVGTHVNADGQLSRAERNWCTAVVQARFVRTYGSVTLDSLLNFLEYFHPYPPPPPFFAPFFFLLFFIKLLKIKTAGLSRSS